MGLNKIYPHDFYDQLLLNKVRQLHSKIELLDWLERPIGEIQGKVIDGSVSVDGNSAIRRTCSLTVIADNYETDLTSLETQVALNKKIKVYVGLTNTTTYQNFGDTIWFPLGVFVLTDASIGHSTTDNTITINAQDKMCLLSGEVGGQLQSPAELHRYATWNETTEDFEYQELLIYDIIKNAVINLGGENPAKVLINNIPSENKVALKYIGSSTKYYDVDNNEVINPVSIVGLRAVEPGDYSGYKLEPFYFPKELVKSPGDSVVSILDDIKNVLGNYEYFYDIDGNFIFQEVKNYTNTSFTPLVGLANGSYTADFSKVPYIYSFKEKDIVQSFNNTPDWKNIKNDFVVWGTRQNGAGVDGASIMYHLAIDNKPYLPPVYEKPWQQFLVEYGDANIADPGVYYQELKGKLPQCYNKDTNTWDSDPSDYTYYFDMIDAKSELGKFSVSTIGRRTKAVVDENVSIMYPPAIPDIVLIPTGSDQAYIDHLVAIGQQFIIVGLNEYNTLYSPGGVGKDAFSTIRDLLYQHTTFNEVITINCMPLYFLDTNRRIEVEDKRSGIYGDYIIKSMAIPLNIEGIMSINAIRVTSRI